MATMRGSSGWSGPPEGSGSGRRAAAAPIGGRGKREGIGSKNDGNLKLLFPSPHRQIFSMNPKQIGRETKSIPNLEAFLLV
jgi:hypothetical protein